MVQKEFDVHVHNGRICVMVWLFNRKNKVVDRRSYYYITGSTIKRINRLFGTHKTKQFIGRAELGVFSMSTVYGEWRKR